mmetsp:Transcript_41931/g.98286  ORF Transcript_41931/g.98286 Transcript_41931/m.98286 type:complete len:84 (+) Transcript_41931:1322-1573(+)
MYHFFFFKALYCSSYMIEFLSVSKFHLNFMCCICSVEPSINFFLQYGADVFISTIIPLYDKDIFSHRYFLSSVRSYYKLILIL